MNSPSFPTKVRALGAALAVVLLLAGCGTRVWGEGGTDRQTWGGVSVPLGKGDGR